MNQAVETAAILSKAVSPRARAKAKNDRVATQAGAPGHILDYVPARPLRTDLVAPVLAFAVYGLPKPQGSKEFRGFRGGKPVLKEASDGLGPWREAVRHMAKVTIQDWRKRSGVAWVALNEPVAVAVTVTIEQTAASRQRGDIWADGIPDLDKLQRGIGDALAPRPLAPGDGAGMTEKAKRQVRTTMMAQRRATSVLHDDSRIVLWHNPKKVYPCTVPESLGFPGCVVQVWKMSELEAASATPTLHDVDGTLSMTAGDLWGWGRPITGETWPAIAERLWRAPDQVLAAPLAPVVLRGRAVSEDGALRVLRTLAVEGPQARVPVALIVPKMDDSLPS